MHKRLCVVVCLSLAADSQAHAGLRFTQPVVNLGELRSGPAYQQRFDFVNDSALPIEILDIRLGCGCLQPVLDQRVFQPGEKGTLLMHLRTLGQQAGSRTWQAHVQYRAGSANHETRLIVGATLRNEITVEPSILAMSIETTVRQEVTVTDHRAVPMRVTAVVASSPALRVSTQASGNGVTKVLLEVSRSALTAPKEEVMLNIHTDDPHYRVLQVPITLTKGSSPQVTATPERVALTGTAAKLVRLRATGDLAVRVERAEADHPALTCTWATGPGNDATLKINVDAAKLPASPAQASVRVRFMEPAMTLTIPVDLRKE